MLQSQSSLSSSVGVKMQSVKSVALPPLPSSHWYELWTIWKAEEALRSAGTGPDVKLLMTASGMSPADGVRSVPGSTASITFTKRSSTRPFSFPLRFCVKVFDVVWWCHRFNEDIPWSGVVLPHCHLRNRPSSLWWVRKICSCSWSHCISCSGSFSAGILVWWLYQWEVYWSFWTWLTVPNRTDGKH